MGKANINVLLKAHSNETSAKLEHFAILIDQCFGQPPSGKLPPVIDPDQDIMKRVRHLRSHSPKWYVCIKY